MIYVFSKLFALVASPSAVLVLITAIGAFLTLRRAQTIWGHRLLITGVAGLLAFAVLPLGQWMLRPLEERFPVPKVDIVDGIIVLGGGVSVDTSVNRDMPLLNEAGDRMRVFVMLARRYPQARLAFAGGNGAPFAAKATEAQIARRFADEMGLDPSRIAYESKSRNTHENAAFAKPIVRPRPGERWLLVTSAADLPRAVGSFRAVGWQVTGYPSNYHTMHGRSHFLPGVVEGLKLADWAAHEWTGLVYYRLRGWTPSLYPGP